MCSELPGRGVGKGEYAVISAWNCGGSFTASGQIRQTGSMSSSFVGSRCGPGFCHIDLIDFFLVPGEQCRRYKYGRSRE